MNGGILHPATLLKRAPDAEIPGTRVLATNFGPDAG